MQGLGMNLLTDLAGAMGHIIQKLALEKDLRGFLWGNSTISA
jgi:hypothetical protein